MLIFQIVIKRIMDDELSISFEEGLELINIEYKKHISETFNKDILFKLELEKIIYNEDGGIKPLDEHIFFKLRLYAAKYLAYSYEAQDNIIENQDKILRGDYEQTLKKLSKLNRHDQSVNANIENHFLKLIFNTGTKKEGSIFRIVDNYNISPLENFTITVLNEEIFEKDNGTFQYNILVGKSSEETYYSFDCISVNFIDVEEICIDI